MKECPILNSKSIWIFTLSFVLSVAQIPEAAGELSDIYKRYLGRGLDIWELEQHELIELRQEIEGMKEGGRKTLLLAAIGDDRGFAYIRQRYQLEKARQKRFGAAVSHLRRTEHPKALIMLADDLDNIRRLRIEDAGWHFGPIRKTAARTMMEIISRSGFFSQEVREWAGEERDNEQKLGAAKAFWRTNAEAIQAEKYNEVTVPEAMDPLASQEERPKGGTRATPKHEEPISVMTNVMEDTVVSQDKADSQVAASSREDSSDGSMGMGQWYWWAGGLLAALGLGLGYMAWNRRDQKDKA